jgi:hypothetical protein
MMKRHHKTLLSILIVDRSVNISLGLKPEILLPSNRKRRAFSIKDAVQSDLRMCTKEPSFYLQTVYLGFYFILCSCKA